MKTKEVSKELAKLYPELKTKHEEMSQNGMLVDYIANDIMLDFADDVAALPFLVRGKASIRILDKTTNEVKEVYSVNPGEMCSLVIMNCITERPSEVRAVCEEPITALMIPRKTATRWLGNDDAFRSALFEDFSTKYRQLLFSL